MDLRTVCLLVVTVYIMVGIVYTCHLCIEMAWDKRDGDKVALLWACVITIVIWPIAVMVRSGMDKPKT